MNALGQLINSDLVSIRSIAFASELFLSTVLAFTAMQCTVSAAEQPATPEVLQSETFVGKAKASYIAAKKLPEICAKLFCYCGCDETDNHKTLLDCFTSEHGVDCSICQDEALIAYKMKQEGKTLAQIQQVIDQKFVADYNGIFEKPSEALLAYRKQRAWTPTPAEAQTENRVGRSGSDEKKEEKTKAGSCCGGH
ncbi:MAG TPA: CYCXC family (seleno)protein [Oculatellaceae cyanobacterium]